MILVPRQQVIVRLSEQYWHQKEELSEAEKENVDPPRWNEKAG